MTLIRKSRAADTAAILAIINAAAQVYRGVIPADRWHEPYMPPDADKDLLLGKYWSIPARQAETSVVLADRRWMDARR